MKKTKIALTLVLIIGLMALLIIIGVAIVLITSYEASTNKTHGILSILAFIVAAFIFGTCMNKVINRIKRLWE